MLQSLTIRDFVLVHRQTLEFSAGFTALTGETGAGKSILLDALELVLGGRADPDAVRQAAERAEVTAEFTLTDASRAWLESNELTTEEDECLLRRVVESTGKSRAFINGRSVTVTQLRALGELLLDIHGQHAHQGLLRGAVQRDLLDTFGGHGELCRGVQSAWQEWQAAEQALTHAAQKQLDMARERAALEETRDLLAPLDLTPGRWETLQAEHSRLSHRAELLQGLEHTLELLAEGDQAVQHQIAQACLELDGLRVHDNALETAFQLLENAQIQVEEARDEVQHHLRGMDLDDQRLSQIEEEMQLWHGLARRLRVHPEELISLRSHTLSALTALESQDSLTHLAARRDQGWHLYEAAAQALTVVRQRAARHLGEQVTITMAELALAQGRFEVTLKPLEKPAITGLEYVEFQVSAHSSQPLAPLAKVASGGELSRLSLALQTQLAGASEVPTLIFDEVDSGTGGAVAERVGQLLASLGHHHQVLCVTHLAQVATCAQQQWRVTKCETGGLITSAVEVLDTDQRIEEIARMLGGVTVTETVRQHAREMLQDKF
jgi:DNA repair protein RecN (Recombination protein N)